MSQLATGSCHFTHIKSPRFPLDTRLGGPQRRSGHSGKNKYLGFHGYETPAHPSHRAYRTIESENESNDSQRKKGHLQRKYRNPAAYKSELPTV